MDTLQIDTSDYPKASELLMTLERKAGGVLCNGYPTSVEVSHATVYGGPFRATSDGRSTSVESAAINRYLRPVCYQELPEQLLLHNCMDLTTYLHSTRPVVCIGFDQRIGSP